jgi:hypothetical protein
MSCDIKVWLKNAEKGIEIVSLTDKRLEEALALMREAFYTDEPPAKGVRLQVRTCLVFYQILKIRFLYYTLHKI